MATVTHAKVSTIPDSDDDSLIRPSDWNAEHVLSGIGTLASQNAEDTVVVDALETGTTTIVDGGSLILTGGNASGEGNIRLGAASSSSYDANIIYLESTAYTAGFIFGSTAAALANNGPYFIGRGNTYSAVSNQRGNVYLFAGNVSGGGATEGRVYVGTGNNVSHIVVDKTGRTLMGVTLPTDNGVDALQVAGTIKATTRYNLPSYTVATLPAATGAGGLIYVSDETGGAVPAFSDGTNWRRVTDRTIVA